MPILINEVIAEIDEQVTQPSEAHAPEQTLPAPENELKLLQTLTLIQQRQERLKVD